MWAAVFEWESSAVSWWALIQITHYKPYTTSVDGNTGLFCAGYFAGSTADYIFMLLFNSICLVIVGLLMGFPILSSALVFCVVYVWCQINKDVIVNFWFGVQVKVRFPSRKIFVVHVHHIFNFSP